MSPMEEVRSEAGTRLDEMMQENVSLRAENQRFREENARLQRDLEAAQGRATNFKAQADAYSDALSERGWLPDPGDVKP